MVNPIQEWELRDDVFEPDGLELQWPPSVSLGLGVCAHHRTYNSALEEVNHTSRIGWFPMPSRSLQSDITARSFFILFLSRMGVTLDDDDELFSDLLSASRNLNNDRTGIAHTAIPVVVLVATVHHMHENSTGDEFDLTEEENQVIEESVEEYVAMQMVPASQSSLDALEKVIVDHCFCSVDQCMICLEKFCDDEMITRMPCSHLYHGDCIIQWLKTSHFCPLCRFEMPT